MLLSVGASNYAQRSLLFWCLISSDVNDCLRLPSPTFWENYLLFYCGVKSKGCCLHWKTNFNINKNFISLSNRFNGTCFKLFHATLICMDAATGWTLISVWNRAVDDQDFRGNRNAAKHRWGTGRIALGPSLRRHKPVYQSKTEWLVHLFWRCRLHSKIVRVWNSQGRPSTFRRDEPGKDLAKLWFLSVKCSHRFQSLLSLNVKRRRV